MRAFIPEAQVDDRYQLYLLDQEGEGPEMMTDPLVFSAELTLGRAPVVNMIGSTFTLLSLSLSTC